MTAPGWMAAMALAAALPAFAQYKVVGPDGRITYSDRPPASADDGKVTTIGRLARRGPPAPDAALPFELRQVVARYPVTLYTGNQCPPCEQARQMLLQRGIPYAERSVTGPDDIAALERLVGGRTIPSLTVGAQPLRGYYPVDWESYLDAAGYPKESRLPRGWQPPPATALVERQTPAGETTAEAPPAIRN